MELRSEPCWDLVKHSVKKTVVRLQALNKMQSQMDSVIPCYTKLVLWVSWVKNDIRATICIWIWSDTSGTTELFRTASSFRTQIRLVSGWM